MLLRIAEMLYRGNCLVKTLGTWHKMGTCKQTARRPKITSVNRTILRKKKNLFQDLKISSPGGKENGLYIDGYLCSITSWMLLDTGESATLLRTGITKDLK